MSVDKEKKKPGSMSIKDLLSELTIKEVIAVVLFLMSLFYAGMKFQYWLNSPDSSVVAAEDSSSDFRSDAASKVEDSRKSPESSPSEPKDDMGSSVDASTEGDCSPVVSGNTGEITIEGDCK